MAGTTRRATDALWDAFDPVDAVALAGVVDAIRAAHPDVAAANGLRHEIDDDGVLLDCATVPLPAFRRLQLRDGVDVVAALDRVPDRDIAGIPVMVRPHDVRLADELDRRGYVEGPDGTHKLVRRPVAPADPVTPCLPIRELGPEHAVAFGALAVESFGLPDSMHGVFAALVGRPRWRCLGAIDGDRVVAAGTVYHENGCAWFANAATAASHRRRGLHRAVLEARVRCALDDGASVLTVDTDVPTGAANNPSFVTCHRAGFSVAHERRAFAPPDRS